ncbi:2-hydroxy-6-oxo-6-phenylhexa-2,4-dienoate hydrolase [Knoellia sinensis KCTC 19936]|uniref:2-hydroxy-6-oxo-6-phenylhexa-2,4-dienoate hydrolase n=1 Tax=Knoellia sinensis KCTC 19936 TaxID=1385520 RepID=A0A0A0J8N1_9MICO|nr:alpha/beta hydrolase [Knoellia sinensis]KGN33790.1 2-hydroxy-6-oxo-6-phenylhexa-2,4-dienoate hydrolase [Knoellia sinensis KCTC 19936]
MSTPALHVVERGPAQGIPVVAIHGWTPDHRIMTGFLEPLFAQVSGYRRIYPDLPAMGRSPVGDAASSADVVDRVEAMLDERLGDATFLLVGESYGGYVAREIVRRRPGQVRGLALVCPVGPVVERASRSRAPGVVLERDEVFLDTLDAQSRREFEDNAVIQTPETYAAFAADVAPGLALADEQGMARIAERWDLGHLPEEGRTFDRPTLWLLGRQDSSVGYRDQWELIEHYPRATFAVLDRAGHNAQFELRGLTESLFRDWLQRVEAEAGEPG